MGGCIVVLLVQQNAPNPKLFHHPTPLNAKRLLGVQVSPDGTLVAFGLDTRGSEDYLAYVHVIASGHTLLGTPIAATSGDYEWSADSSTLFYVTQNGTTSRPCTVWAQQLLPPGGLGGGGGASAAAADGGGDSNGGGGGASDDDAALRGFIPPPPLQLYHEPDDAFYLGLDATGPDGHWLLLTAASETTAEVRALDVAAAAAAAAEQPSGGGGGGLGPGSWRLLGGREPGVRVKAAAWRGDAFLLLVVSPDAPNGELQLLAPLLQRRSSGAGAGAAAAAAAAAAAEPLVVLPHRREVAVEDFRVLAGHLVLAERQLGHTTLTVYCLPANDSDAARSACRYNSTSSHEQRASAAAPHMGVPGSKGGAGGSMPSAVGGAAAAGNRGVVAGAGPAAFAAQQQQQQAAGAQPGLVIRGRGDGGDGGGVLAFTDMSALPAADGSALPELVLESGTLLGWQGDQQEGEQGVEQQDEGQQQEAGEGQHGVGSKAGGGSGAAGSEPPPLVLAPEASWQVAFEEDCYSVTLLDSGCPSLLRLTYTSFTTPDSVIDIHLATQRRRAHQVRPVRGPFSASDYRSSRLWARGDDGVPIPLSLVYRLDAFRRDGSNPALLMAYGGARMFQLFIGPQGAAAGGWGEGSRGLCGGVLAHARCGTSQRVVRGAPWSHTTSPSPPSTHTLIPIRALLSTSTQPTASNTTPPLTPACSRCLTAAGWWPSHTCAAAVSSARRGMRRAAWSASPTASPTSQQLPAHSLSSAARARTGSPPGGAARAG